MWLSLLITVLSYLFQKKKGVSSSKAALGALAVGAGTYYVQTETDWGKTNLNGLDDYMNSVGKSTPVLDEAGNQVIDPSTGQPLLGPAPQTTKTNTGVLSGIGSFLSNNAGTVAALGAGAALGGMSPVVLIGGLVLLLVLVK